MSMIAFKFEILLHHVVHSWIVDQFIKTIILVAWKNSVKFSYSLCLELYPKLTYTCCIACLRQATFLFVNGIWWNCSKTLFSMFLEYVRSFIKIGGVVFEKTPQDETGGLLDLSLGLNLYCSLSIWKYRIKILIL